MKWFADDAFWEWSFPLMFPARRWDEAGEEVQQVLALSGVDQGAVLDLACGPGRHSVEFAARGFQVTGVDRSGFLLDHARRHGESREARVEWIEEDMRAFSRPDAYDLAISIFTSFGYFDHHEENLTVLQSVFANLRPGGTFVIHVLGREPLARRFIATDFKELDGDRLLVQHREVIDDWTRLRATWILIDGASAQRYGFTVWIYSGSELRRMLEEVGFEGVELYGSLDGRAYDVQAQRLIAVGVKPL
jgi:SAM-dependent methyltransferase